MTGGVKQTAAQKSRCRTLPSWPLSSNPHHNADKSFQLASFSLLAVLVFALIVYDGDFTNIDPPFQVSALQVVLACHHNEARLIGHRGEIVCLSIIDKFNLLSRSPPLR
jgi:hypothetical protein